MPNDAPWWSSLQTTNWAQLWEPALPCANGPKMLNSLSKYAKWLQTIPNKPEQADALSSKYPDEQWQKCNIAIELSLGLLYPVFSRSFERSKFSNGLSKYRRTSLHNHRQNAIKPRFMTISIFRWSSCGLSNFFTATKVKSLRKLIIYKLIRKQWLRTEDLPIGQN